MPKSSSGATELRPSCPICLHIARAFATAFYDEFSVVLGSTEQVLSSSCGAHLPFLLRLTGLNWREDGLENREISLLKPKSRTYLQICLLASSNRLLELVKKDNVPNHAGLGRVLDANWIDHATLRCWYERCSRAHGRECDAPEYMRGLLPAKPSLFVDTRTNSLVSARPGISYVALSYVWGQVDSFKTNMSMLAELKSPDSLSREHIRQHVPATIRDAIRIVPMFGERYLWVDSLCIIQDDEESKQDQLNQMGAIYSHASITLIAVDGADSQRGLRGFKGVTQSRRLEQEVVSFGDGDRCVEHIFPLDFESSATYYQRGWTFQERIFSKRRIYFEKESVRWECSCSNWYEDLEFGNRLERSDVRVWQTSISKFYPCLNSYSEMFHELSKLDFTYEEDILQACAGLTSALSKNFLGGFISGLPELFFDVALLWQPRRPGSRRMLSRRSDMIQPPNPLPSWSWAGWDSQLELWSWQPGCGYVKIRCERKALLTITPITTWYTADMTLPTRVRRISSDWNKYESLAQDPESSLPAGWSRHVCHEEVTSDSVEKDMPDNFGSYYFVHELDPQTKFWFPIPIASPEDEPSIRSATRYLFGKTQIAFFFSDKSLADTSHPCISIRSPSGTWAGILRLNKTTDVTLFREGLAGRERCELVAVSQGHASNSIRHEPDLDEWTLRERPKSTPLYEYYNVLWVEREGDIMYRRALGRVLKDAWHSQNPELTSVILG